MGKIQRIDTDPRRSRVVVYNGIVWIGGQTPDDRSQDIRGQTRQVLAKIDGFLAKADSDKSLLLSAQIWLANVVRDAEGMNAVWDAWLAPGCAPTRASAEVNFASKELLVEITVTAAVSR